MLSPGVFCLFLLVFNLPIVFTVTGLTTLAMGHVCKRMHPRFGLTRQKLGLAVRARSRRRPELLRRCGGMTMAGHHVSFIGCPPFLQL